MQETDEKKDKELYRSFLKGNNESFNEIIRRYRKSLISFIFRYVKNIEVAEDISQDTFVYVLINRKEYDFKYSLKTYLYTIAKCRALNYIQKNKKIILLDESHMANKKMNFYIEENLEKEDEKRLLMKAISKLKLEYQNVIILRELEGFTYKEICKILNKTMPQVKVLIYRAKKSLKEKIGREE